MTHAEGRESSILDALPEPDGQRVDETPWWRLSSGEHVYAANGTVYGPFDCRPLDHLEQDALAVLAAVAYARRPQAHVDRSSTCSQPGR
jgi:hypothetical protein